MCVSIRGTIRAEKGKLLFRTKSSIKLMNWILNNSSVNLNELKLRKEKKWAKEARRKRGQAAKLNSTRYDEKISFSSYSRHRPLIPPSIVESSECLKAGGKINKLVETPATVRNIQKSWKKKKKTARISLKRIHHTKKKFFCTKEKTDGQNERNDSEFSREVQ